VTDDIVTRLRAWILCYRADTDISLDLAKAAAEIERLRKERDEARDIACDMFARRSTVNRLAKARWYARHMGWDCFKEVTDGRW
jgi:hypothetical protein